MLLNGSFHSVTLDKEKCKGCTNCIKKCPTEAIRVRDGKAHIISERCIDCGECIRVCPYHAKKAMVDSFNAIKGYKYKIALPAPSFYAQYKKQDDINKVLTALINIGFDHVFEVAKAADLVTEAAKILLSENKLKLPAISSACPAVVKLIRIRFPNLIEHLVPLRAPMELAAMLARKEAMEKYGFSGEDIGVFFISPCAAKASAVKSITPGMYTINGVFSMAEIYLKVLSALGDIKAPKQLARSTKYGIRWGMSGGEMKALNNSFQMQNHVAVDSINNVIKLLEQLEDDQLKDISFVECNACQNGCVGGALAVENSFLSRTYLKKITETITSEPDCSVNMDDVLMEEELTYIPVLKLSDDIGKAMQMMTDMNKIYKDLPGLDCGSCGAPTCRALSEDIVRGVAEADDCLFKMRERVRSLVDEMQELEGHIPPPFRKPKEEQND